MCYNSSFITIHQHVSEFSFLRSFLRKKKNFICLYVIMDSKIPIGLRLQIIQGMILTLLLFFLWLCKLSFFPTINRALLVENSRNPMNKSKGRKKEREVGEKEWKEGGRRVGKEEKGKERRKREERKSKTVGKI